MSDGTERPSKWIPMSNLVDLAHLGKLGEEVGELAAIISRCIIQGINENDPETGKPNRQALTEEIADVSAMAEMTISRFDLNRSDILARHIRKVAMKTDWHKMIEDIKLFKECDTCKGSGFSGRGSGYDAVCSNCGGQKYLPVE